MLNNAKSYYYLPLSDKYVTEEELNEYGGCNAVKVLSVEGHLYMKRLIHGDYTEYSALEKKVTEALIPMMNELMDKGFQQQELKAAISGIVHGYHFAFKLEASQDPLPADWRYDLKIGHIHNIKVYRRVFGVGLIEAKYKCDEILRELGKEGFEIR